MFWTNGYLFSNTLKSVTYLQMDVPFYELTKPQYMEIQKGILLLLGRLRYFFLAVVSDSCLDLSFAMSSLNDERVSISLNCAR